MSDIARKKAKLSNNGCDHIIWWSESSKRLFATWEMSGGDAWYQWLEDEDHWDLMGDFTKKPDDIEEVTINTTKQGENND